MTSVRRVRSLGLVAGSAIGFAISWVNPLNGGSAVPFGLATVIAGATGGWLMAPFAWRAHTARRWAGVVLGLALVSIVIGDLAVVTIAAFAPSVQGPTFIVERLAQVVALFLLGLLVVGWLMVIPAMAAAALWAVVMWAIRAERPATAEAVSA